MNDNSACINCAHIKCDRNIIDGLVESEDIYCEAWNDENFGTRYGCMDYKERDDV